MSANNKLKEKSQLTLQEIVSFLTNVEETYDQVTGNYPSSLQAGDKENVSNFGNWIKSIFSKWKNDIKILGVHNNSIYVSIMSCIDSKFDDLDISQQKKYIDELKARLYSEVTKTDIFETYGYKKLGWKKNNLLSILKNNDQTMEILRLLADHFNINIFVIDNEEQQIQIHYNEGEFCPFKESVILLRTKTGFDPIIYKNNITTFNYNNSFFCEFMENSMNKLVCPSYDLKKDADMIRELKILKAGQKNEEIEDTVEDIFYKKMKLDKIQNFAKEYGIPIKMGKKYKTKNILYEELKEKLNNKGLDYAQVFKKN
jgi:hypothetical protein